MTAPPDPRDRPGHGGRDTWGSTTDQAMTRSEDALRVGTTQWERGRVRLGNYVTTEQVQQTVPVRRERLDTDTVTDQERAAEPVRKERIDLDDQDTRGGRHEHRRRR